MRRWLRGLLIALLILLVVGAGAAAWLLRTGDMFERLIPDVQAAYAPRQRPLHVETPLPTSFAEIVTPALPALKKAYADGNKLPEDVRKACDEVREGTRPFSELPQECRDILSTTWSAVQQALEATHAAKLEFPRATGGLDARFYQESTRPPGVLPYQTATKLVAIDIRRRLDAGELNGVAEECVDALALGRDVSHAGALVPFASATSITKILLAQCEAALHRASPTERDAATTRILRVRDGWPSFDRIVEDESVFQRIALATAWHGMGAAAGMPAPATDLVAFFAQQNGTGQDATTIFLNWTAPLTWRASDEQFRQLKAALQLPVAQQTAALHTVHENLKRRENSLSLFVAMDFSVWHARYLRVIQSLTLLAAAGKAESFRAAQSRWPTAAELVASVPGLEESTFTLTPRDAQLELRLKPTPELKEDVPPGFVLSPN